MSYADRVHAGVTLLDKELPGWHSQINLPVLDMSDCSMCVLGQLFRGFQRGLNSLGLADVEDAEVFGEPGITACDAGFDVSFHEKSDDGPISTNYRTLLRLWTYVIRSRQKAERVS